MFWKVAFTRSYRGSQWIVRDDQLLKLLTKMLMEDRAIPSKSCQISEQTN